MSSPCNTIVRDRYKIFVSQQTLFWQGPLLEEVFCTYEGNLSEGIHHGEDHPDVDHLDVRCCWKALADADEAGGKNSTCVSLQAGQCHSECLLILRINTQLNVIVSVLLTQLSSTYKVARTSITVRLTWTTMVRNWSVNMLISWLRNISIPVGKVTWWNYTWKVIFWQLDIFWSEIIQR